MAGNELGRDHGDQYAAWRGVQHLGQLRPWRSVAQQQKAQRTGEVGGHRHAHNGDQRSDVDHGLAHR
ncbi:hypothetical protein D3C71_2144230 [compost metagenome]